MTDTCAIDAAYAKALDAMKKAGYTPYPHQEEGIKWMISRDMVSFTKGGLLCDDPGLGKTLQTLAMIAGTTKSSATERTLIICPISLLDQWREAAKKMFPHAKIRVCHGATSFKTKQEIENSGSFIVLASYNKVFGTEKGVYLRTVLHTVSWTRIICDEIHKIKNKNSKLWKGCNDINAVSRWGLTGTPLQNNISDMRSLFAYLHICDLMIKTNMDGLKDTFILRRNRHILPDAYKSLNINIEDIGFDDPLEQQFYENLRVEIQKEFIQLTRSNIDGRTIMSHIFELLLRLRQATIHPCLVYNGLLRKLITSQDDTYENMDATRQRLIERIRFWSKRPSTKIKKILEMVRLQSPQDKTLIVSHFVEEADLIYVFLRKNFPHLRVEIFDGSLTIEKRNEMIDRAKAGLIDCLIIQIQCGGVGLNLQMFNKVYITTPDWNPCNEIQAIARCHRIGQDRDVDVVKIVIENESGKPTIDERIISIQNSKRNLMAEYLKDSTLEFNEKFLGKGDIKRLTMKDFAYLFK